MTNNHHKPWYARFAYVKIWIPSSDHRSLTPRHNAVYWRIRTKPRQRQVYYALRLGIDEKTVARAVERLRHLELISWSALEPLDLRADHLPLWQDKAKRTVTAREFRLSQFGILSQFAGNSSLGWSKGDRSVFENLLDGYGNQMRSAGYSKVEIRTYWEQICKQILKDTNSLEVFDRFAFEFGRIFQHVEKVTLRNRVAGTFNGANGLGLLNTITHRPLKRFM